MKAIIDQAAVEAAQEREAELEVQLTERELDILCDLREQQWQDYQEALSLETLCSRYSSVWANWAQFPH